MTLKLSRTFYRRSPKLGKQLLKSHCVDRFLDRSHLHNFRCLFFTAPASHSQSSSVAPVLRRVSRAQDWTVVTGVLCCQRDLVALRTQQREKNLIPTRIKDTGLQPAYHLARRATVSSILYPCRLT